MSEYLESELLAHLSEDELHFLTRTAVLERMSGPLCDAVLEESGSGPILESLARSNLFLVPLDRSQEWYRYHHLFQELLRSELPRAEPDLMPVLLARATEWCVENGYPEAAIAYAQQAGDVDRVARLVELCAQFAYQSGRVATVERWLVWLEARGALESNASVAVLGGLLAAVRGRPAEAERCADTAERGRPNGPLPDGSPSSDSWLALLKAQLCRHGAASMRADADLAVQEIARGSPFHPSALLLAGMSRWMEGKLDEADDLFADAAEEGLELGAPEPASVAQGGRALLAIAQDRWDEAEQLADKGARIIRHSRIDEYPVCVCVYAAAARIALHRGNAPLAQEFLGRAQRLRPRLTYALPHFSIQIRLELARAYLANADAGGAETMLREIKALLRRRPGLATLPAQAEELRATLNTMRADAPGHQP